MYIVMGRKKKRIVPFNGMRKLKQELNDDLSPQFQLSHVEYRMNEKKLYIWPFFPPLVYYDFLFEKERLPCLMQNIRFP